MVQATQKKALLYAVKICKDADRLILMNAQSPKENRLLQNIPKEQLEQYYLDEGNKILAEADEILAEVKNEVIRKVCIGYPALEIANVAKKYDAYSIIMGSRGLSPAVGNVLGSVTYRVIHLAPCPITIVPNLYKEE